MLQRLSREIVSTVAPPPEHLTKPDRPPPGGRGSGAPAPEAEKPKIPTAAQRLREARLAKLHTSVPREDPQFGPPDNPNRPTESEEGRIRAMREKRTAGKLKPLGRSLSREPED